MVGLTGGDHESKAGCTRECHITVIFFRCNCCAELAREANYGFKESTGGRRRVGYPRNAQASAGDFGF